MLKVVLGKIKSLNTQWTGYSMSTTKKDGYAEGCARKVLARSGQTSV